MVTLLKSSLVNERWGQEFTNLFSPNLPYVVDTAETFDDDTTSLSLSFTVSSLNYGYMVVCVTGTLGLPTTLTWNGQTLTRPSFHGSGNDRSGIYILSRPAAATSNITATMSSTSWGITAFTLENITAGNDGMLVGQGNGYVSANTRDLPFSESGITILCTSGRNSNKTGFPINFYKPIGSLGLAWWAYSHKQHERSWYQGLMCMDGVNPDNHTTAWSRLSFNGIRSI